MNQARQKQSGFTLIELLVVIAIIAILAAILFPVFAKVRENARRTAGASNIRQEAMAIMQYVQDTDEKYPRCGWGEQFDPATPPQWHNTMEEGEWQDATAPFHKSAGIFLSVGDASTGGGTNDADNGNCSLLFNDIISHDMPTLASGFADCTNQDKHALARNLGAIVSPSDCVLLMEGHGGWSKMSGRAAVGLPATLTPDWTGSTSPASKWHLEESMSGYQSFLVAGTSYGGWGQHSGGVPFYSGKAEVAYCDGHVKTIAVRDGNNNLTICSALPWTKSIDPQQRMANDTNDYCNTSGPNAPGVAPGNWQ